MGQVFHIAHTTTYSLARPVAGLEVMTRLRPPATPSQGPRHVSVTVTPAAESRTAETSGTVERYLFRAPVRDLKVAAQFTVAHTPDGTGDGAAPPGDSEPAAEPEAGHPLIRAWSAETLPERDVALADIRRFADRLHRDFAFDPAATTRATSLVEFFTGCRGVCEDFARLATACLRARGVPVRHVVGYLLPGMGRDSCFGRHAHAWISVWDRQAGWVDLDPTTNLAVPDHHVTLVRGLDRDDTLPVSGRFDGGESVEQRVSVDVSIVRQ